MPIVWNLDVINRNQLIITAFLLCFCPWPLLTVFFVFLLAGPVNEWEEERLGVTLDDFLELYLHLYGFDEREVPGILAAQDKFWNIEINQARTDHEIAHGDEIYKEVRKEYEELQQLKKQGKLNPTGFYEWKNEQYYDVNELAVVRMDHLIHILEHAKRDYDSVVPLYVPLDNLTVDSLDFYLNRVVRREFQLYLKELRQQALSSGVPNPLLVHVKQTFFARWYMQSHVNMWLNCYDYQDKFIFKQDYLSREFKKDYAK